MSNKRLKRIKDFEKFLGSAEEKFVDFKEKDARAKFFEETYSFYAKSGGRIGGLNKRVFEVFYGKRVYDSMYRGLELKGLIEEGATLVIEVTDTGTVYVSIFPAKTEFRVLAESSVFIYKSIEPDRLLSDRFLRRIWADFLAYMEFSSLEGEPTLIENARIKFIRYSKNLTIDNKVEESRLTKVLTRAVEFVFTIGLSGIIVFLISLRLVDKQKVELNESVKALNETLQKIEGRQITEEDMILYLSKIDSFLSKKDGITHQKQDIYRKKN